jgi:hypothetical protein
MSPNARTTSPTTLILAAVALAFGGTGVARAAIYRVGAGDGCTNASIAEAVAAEQAHPGANGDAIYVASNRDTTQEANTIVVNTASDKSLSIVGGFADCMQANSDGSHAIIDGTGGAAGPVFRFMVGAGGAVSLFALTIQGGDAAGSAKGGGIYFGSDSAAGLGIYNCTITQNSAGYGGGIYAERTSNAFGGSGITLTIGSDVAIVGNTARFDGGGLALDGGRLTTGAGSYIANNHAPNGYGGGLLLLAAEVPTLASFSNSGLGNLGVIYLNDASRGGGIAVLASELEAQLQLIPLGQDPLRIRGNAASIDGGGIYLGRAGDVPGNVRLKAKNVYIEDNIAPHGAAISVRDLAGAGSGVFFNAPDGIPINCPVGKACGGIAGNAAIGNDSQPAGGIVEATAAIVRFYRMTFEGNAGQFVLFGNDGAKFETHHVAITGNTVSNNVIAADIGSDNTVDIENTTIAGNTIGTDFVLRLASTELSPGKLYQSIIWQPLKTTLHLTGDPLALFDDLVSEGFSVDGGNSSSVVVRNPRFVDPGHGDYSLRAGSPALDYTTSVAGDDRDLYSSPRDVDLPIVANGGGRRDVGAIERQALQPLVLDSDFDLDLRSWSEASAGATTWDGTRNASGAAGSGSAHVTRPNAVTGTQVAGLIQCVHLPGPGSYALNGWGRGTGSMVTAGDIAELVWEYRKNGGEDCTLGAPTANGTKILSTGSSWTRPATPTYIEVTEQDWTSYSSIVVTLVAVENGASGAPTNAWFDGITLRIDGDDTIFASGFDVP